MKIFAYLSIFFLISCSNSSLRQVRVKKEKKESVFPYKIHKKVLSNGLKILAVPFDSPGLVTYSTVVQAGSRDEIEKGVTGFAHFFEHLMFYGSKKYPKERIKKINKSLAAGGNANTTNDRTFYYLTGNSDRLETFFQVASDNFQNLHLSKAEFKKEAGAVLGEYTKNYSSWYRQLDSKMRELAFKKHTYQHSTMGYEADIKDMPNQYDYAWKFFGRFYRPEYCALIIVGDIKPNTVFKLAEKYYGSWERGSYTANIPKEPVQKKEERGHIERGGILPSMMIAYKTPSFMSNLKETIALETIGTLLSSNKSDFYRRLVFEEQKAKSLWAWQSSQNKDPQVFRVVFRVDLKKSNLLKELLNELQSEIETIKTEPIDKKFLSDIKSNTKYGMLSGLNNPQSIAATLASYYQKSGKTDIIDQYFDALDQLTTTDIMNVAKKYFTNENRTIVDMYKNKEDK